MFSIEHEFDATVITLIDETDPNSGPLNEDVVIQTFDDRVIVEQFDPDSGELAQIILTIEQLEELREALALEGDAFTTQIGGASLAGGRGSVRGTLIGAFVIGFLSDGLVLPQGAHICFAAGPLCRDDAIIPNPQPFDGFPLASMPKCLS